MSEGEAVDVGPSRHLIPIVDTHVHFWDRTVDGLRWPWLEEGFTSQLHTWTTAAATERLAEMRANDRFGVREFRREAAGAGVGGLVHAHAATCRDDPVQETAWLADVRRAEGWPSAVIGRCDLADPGAPDLLRRHCAANPSCTSVRDMNGPAGLDLDACDPALRVAAELGLSVELRTPPERFSMFVELAQRHPDVTFVMSHGALPRERTPSSLVGYRHEAAKVAAMPNWVCKISALCGGSDPDWTVASITPWAEVCCELFGVERSMLGSNWPVDRLFGDYVDVIAAYRTIYSTLSTDEQHQLFHGTAAQVYRIEDQLGPLT